MSGKTYTHHADRTESQRGVGRSLPPSGNLPFKLAQLCILHLKPLAELPKRRPRLGCGLHAKEHLIASLYACRIVPLQEWFFVHQTWCAFRIVLGALFLWCILLGC